MEGDASHSSHTLRRELMEISEEAVEFTVAELYERHPQLLERFGPAGRKVCREDIAHHLEFLGAAIGAATAQPFVAYVKWLRTLLEARGVPLEPLRDSFSILAEFFRDHASQELSDAASGVLAEARDALDSAKTPAPLTLLHTPEPILKLDGLVSSLIRGRHADVLDLIRGSSDDDGYYADVAVHIIQPAMYDVGRLWHECRVSVAQEHLATSTSQYVLSEILAEQHFANPTGKSSMVACVEANHHSLGARMVADALMIAGWDVQFLGANTPSRDLLQHIDRSRPDLLGLSVSLPPQLETARALIAAIHAEMGTASPTIMVGGLAVNQIDSIWKQFGADIWGPDVKTAMAEVA